MSSKIIKFKIHLTYLALSLSFNILSHWVLIFMAQKMIKTYRNIKNSKKKKMIKQTIICIFKLFYPGKLYI